MEVLISYGLTDLDFEILLVAGYDLEVISSFSKSQIQDLIRTLKEPEEEAMDYQEVEEPRAEIIYCANKTSILINCMIHNGIKQFNCEYCLNIRGDSEEKQASYLTGFTSGKLRADDFEKLLNLGFTRSGNYFYQKDIVKSCCDVFQYRVDIEQYQPNS